MTLPATVFGNIADRVLFPAISKIQHEKRKVASAYLKGISLIALVTVPLSVTMFILAPEIISILLGSQWIAAVVPFQILSVGALFRTSYKISESTARAMGVVYKTAGLQGIYSIFVLLGAWVGQYYGIAGVSLGVLGALTGIFIFLSTLAVKITNISLRTFLYAHLPSLLMGFLVAVEIFLLSEYLRKKEAPDLSIIMAAVFFLLFDLALLVLAKPKWLLGEQGVWLMNFVMEKCNSIFSQNGFLNKFRSSSLKN